MKSMYESVLEFHKTFGLDAPDRPTMPGCDLLTLRYKLTSEENFEKRCSDTLVEYLDAVADLLYVVHGDAIAAGISKEQLERAFREVHESNMSKMWTLWEIIDAEKDHEWRDSHTHKHTFGPGIVKFDEKVYIVKNLAGKVIKSPSYKAVDLSWIEQTP